MRPPATSPRRAGHPRAGRARRAAQAPSTLASPSSSTKSSGGSAPTPPANASRGVSRTWTAVRRSSKR
eukprot:7594037-Pyramimonas_sp.AAC.1